MKIFKERLGIVNKNGIRNLEPKYYEKVKEFVIKDSPEEKIVKQIFKIEGGNDGALELAEE